MCAKGLKNRLKTENGIFHQLYINVLRILHSCEQIRWMCLCIICTFMLLKPPYKFPENSVCCCTASFDFPDFKFYSWTHHNETLNCYWLCVVILMQFRVELVHLLRVHLFKTTLCDFANQINSCRWTETRLNLRNVGCIPV